MSPAIIFRPLNTRHIAFWMVVVAGHGPGHHGLIAFGLESELRDHRPFERLDEFDVDFDQVVRLALGERHFSWPTLSLPSQAMIVPAPEGGPSNVTLAFGSSLAQGDHASHLWKSLT